MASIEKRIAKNGAVSYRVKIRTRGQLPESSTFRRLTDAKRWAKQTEGAIVEGRHFKNAEGKRHTLGELIDRYLEEVLPNKRPNTIRSQSQQLRWWKDHLGDRMLAEITPALVAEYRDKLTRGNGRARGPASVRRYLAALSHVFTVAVKEWGWLEDNPLTKVSKPKEPRGRVRFLSDDERARLLQACRESSNPDLYTAVVLALSTAARRMEIWGLRWSQVDPRRGTITVEETKNSERRSLTLVGHALELVHERAKVRRIDTDLIFPAPSDPQTPIDFRWAWEVALKRAQVGDFCWHDLRHSAASYLAMNSASLAEIAEILGHKTLEMAKRYTHLSEAHTAHVVASMNEKIFGRT